jgi:hypothetical protein
MMATQTLAAVDLLGMSKLEQTWAWFFRLAGWQWSYKPIVNLKWRPTFHVRFECGHSECPSHHELYVLVSPQSKPVDPFIFADLNLTTTDALYYEPYTAIFGNHPDATSWHMSHGSGGGIYNIVGWMDWESLWEEAIKRSA